MVEKILNDKTLTFEQQVVTLARYAENSIDPISKSDKFNEYFSAGAFCDMREGSAPYRPRYIMPNYEKLMNEGCKFLELEVPTNIWEATNNLLIFYKHTPSITTFPVYLGNIDTLLDPFVSDDEASKMAIRLFLQHIDKTLTDSFVHANIGPTATVAGKLILEVMEELELAIPNLTIKYDKDITSKEFATLCARVSLKTAKPSFANDKIYSKDFESGYGIASCYNGLMIGGGGFTLSRIRLNILVDFAKDKDDFLNNILPNAASELINYMNARIDFMVDNTAFFKSNFLVKEGFVDQNKFSAMLGIVGLAEAVNDLLNANDKSERFGYSQVANDLGEQICQILYDATVKNPSNKTTAFEGRAILHAQVGIEDDINSSPGARIPVGEEPEIYDHIIMSAPFHQYFISGIGDIFVFDQTYIEKPEAIVDIIDGAMTNNLRYISTYSEYCDVVRVTGYLVKKSEIAKLEKGEAVLNDATILGKGARDYGKALDRRRRG